MELVSLNLSSFCSSSRVNLTRLKALMPFTAAARGRHLTVTHFYLIRLVPAGGTASLRTSSASAAPVKARRPCRFLAGWALCNGLF